MILGLEATRFCRWVVNFKKNKPAGICLKAVLVFRGGGNPVLSYFCHIVDAVKSSKFSSRCFRPSGVLCCKVGWVVPVVSNVCNVFIFRVLDCLILKMSTPRSFETSRITRPTAQRHKPEDLNLQQYCCENLKSRRFNLCLIHANTVNIVVYFCAINLRWFAGGIEHVLVLFVSHG